jgi:hypothetical protein
MAVTITTRLNQMEWLFYEKGMQSVWNELKRWAESTLGSGFTGKPGGVTVLGDIDTTLATHLAPTAGVPNTGAPNLVPGSNAPGWGSGQQQNPPPAAIRPPTLDQP